MEAGAQSSKLAIDWIAYEKAGQACDDETFENGFALNLYCKSEPSVAWEAIKKVLYTLDTRALYSDDPNETHRIAADLGAGPLETLIAQHGDHFIEVIEAEARYNRALVWVLGCVWRNKTSSSVWERIRLAAGGISR